MGTGVGRCSSGFLNQVTRPPLKVLFLAPPKKSAKSILQSTSTPLLPFKLRSPPCCSILTVARASLVASEADACAVTTPAADTRDPVAGVRSRGGAAICSAGREQQVSEGCSEGGGTGMGNEPGAGCRLGAHEAIGLKFHSVRVHLRGQVGLLRDVCFGERSPV